VFNHLFFTANAHHSHLGRIIPTLFCSTSFNHLFFAIIDQAHNETQIFFPSSLRAKVPVQRTTAAVAGSSSPCTRVVETRRWPPLSPNQRGLDLAGRLLSGLRRLIVRSAHDRRRRIGIMCCPSQQGELAGYDEHWWDQNQPRSSFFFF
jgi:hypothetical protein